MRANRNIEPYESGNTFDEESGASRIIIGRVKPTKALWFTSMPCEQRTAAIRNKIVNCMEQNDIRAVAYRYLQNRRLEQEAWFEMGLVSIGPAGVMISDREVSFCILLLILLAISPMLYNASRTRETRQACELWLTKTLGQDEFQSIQKLPYYKDSFFKINMQMDKKTIAPAFIENIPKYFQK